MKQALVVGPERIELEDTEPPEPGPGQVRVWVTSCGVCASELPGYLAGPDGGAPLRPGHEVSGVIDKVGAGVGGLRPGTSVTGLFHGGFAEYAVTTSDRVLPVPDGLDADDVMGEPWSCVVSAANRMRVDVGDTVALVGLGFMGLLMLQLIRHQWSARVIGVDPRQHVRDAALRMGADEVVAPDQVPASLLIGMRHEIAPDTGVDLAVEATGVGPGLTLAARMVREHGRLSILGYHNHGGGDRTLDMQLWNWKALEVLNAHDRRDGAKMVAMRQAMRMLAAGRIDTRPLITHRLPLERIDEAFQLSENKPEGYIKALIEMR
jgi:threonine dehydrogenase-like Zn-dependent dehydrogenase